MNNLLIAARTNFIEDLILDSILNIILYLILNYPLFLLPPIILLIALIIFIIYQDNTNSSSFRIKGFKYVLPSIRLVGAILPNQKTNATQPKGKAITEAAKELVDVSLGENEKYVKAKGIITKANKGISIAKNLRNSFKTNNIETEKPII